MAAKHSIKFAPFTTDSMVDPTSDIVIDGEVVGTIEKDVSYTGASINAWQEKGPIVEGYMVSLSEHLPGDEYAEGETKSYPKLKDARDAVRDAMKNNQPVIDEVRVFIKRARERREGQLVARILECIARDKLPKLSDRDLVDMHNISDRLTEEHGVAS